MKSGQELGQGPPLPSFGQNPKEQLLFFVKSSLTQSVRYVGIDLLGQLKSKEVSWSKQELREDLTTLRAFGIVLGTARNCLCAAATVILP